LRERDKDVDGKEKEDLNAELDDNASILNDEIEDAIYAKVMCHLGDSRVKIYYENEKKQGTEGIALIRNLLRRRGQVPITSNDVVVVTPRTFETENAKKHFDLIAVLTRKEVMELKKQKKVPDYFLLDTTSDSFAKKADDDVEFDYAEDNLFDVNETDKKKIDDMINAI
jgi:translation initiation factor IF-1